MTRRLALVGVGAGLLSGLLGIGGGIIIVPGLIWGAGLSRHTASGTSLLAILPIAVVAAITYAVAPGGATRSASVRAALAAAPAAGAIVVHDAARPLVTPEHFTAALAALADADCATAAAPVTDTIKEAGPDRLVTATLDRSRLWAIQTPQAFRRPALERALGAGDDVLAQATDDAWLVERTGGTVRVVESTPANLKVTTPHDLRIAEHLLADRLPRPPAH